MLERYVDGACSATEEMAVLRELASRGESRVAIDALRAARRAETRDAPGPEFLANVGRGNADAIQRLTARLAARGSLSDTSPQSARGLSSDQSIRRVGPQPGLWSESLRYSTAWRVAAAVLIAGSVGVAANMLRRGGRAVPAVREYATAPGQRLSSTLVDGTQFTLGPVSRLRVPVTYGRDARAVELDGEGYFAVRHDAVRPFAVRAHDVVTRDLGTRFDVRAYGAEPVQVAVAEGAVAVGATSGAAAGRTELRPGDVAMIAHGEVTLTHGVDVSVLTGWTGGQLAYHDATADRVVGDLRRWYGVDLVLGDPSLAHQHVTATFTSGESADDALEVLRALLGARVERAGARVILQTALQPVGGIR